MKKSMIGWRATQVSTLEQAIVFWARAVENAHLSENAVALAEARTRLAAARKQMEDRRVAELFAGVK